MNSNSVKQGICDDMEYLFSKINWGESFLDAKAIDIMNTLRKRIMGLELNSNIYNDN